MGYVLRTESVFLTLSKDVNGTWETVTSQVTDSKGQITVDNLHWFDYAWSCTNVPKGYVRLADTDFSITYDHLSETNHVVLYLKRVILTLDSQVSDIIEGETPPGIPLSYRGNGCRRRRPQL